MTAVGTRLPAATWLGMFVCDREGVVVTANEQTMALLGLSEADLMGGTRPAGWCAREPTGAPAPPLAEVIRQSLRTGTRAMRPLVVTNGAERRTLLAVITPDADGAIVELRAVQADLRAATGLLDPLTGLPNTILLGDRLGQAVTRARTLGGLVSVVVVDLDGTDEVLVELGARLRVGMRADHTVARYGSAFVVVAEHPHGTGAAIADLARGLANDIAVRIGWATTDGSAPGHELLARAEEALISR